MNIVKVAGAVLLFGCGTASIILISWAIKEIQRLKKEVARLRRLFTKVCKNWSRDAEEVKREILEMVADNEAEKAELRTKLKNEKHARKQLAKGGRK